MFKYSLFALCLLNVIQPITCHSGNTAAINSHWYFVCCSIFEKYLILVQQICTFLFLFLKILSPTTSKDDFPLPETGLKPYSCVFESQKDSCITETKGSYPVVPEVEVFAPSKAINHFWVQEL